MTIAQAKASRIALRLGLIVFALLVLGTGTATSAVRLAAPDASGSSPCNPSPCGLITAVSGAKDGDQVQLAPGTYAVGADLNIGKAVDVGGSPGASTSIVFSGGKGAKVRSAGAVLHDVRVALAEETMESALVLEGGTVERVYADGTNGGACTVTHGTILDSACFGALSVLPSLPGKFTVTLRNVTAAPLLFGAFEGAQLKATAVNVIGQPGYGLGSNKAGVLIDVSAGSSAEVALANSNYPSVDTSLSTGIAFSVTPAGTNGNQTAPAQFVNGPAGDFRQLETSPTVDAGLADVTLGPLAIDGAPRSLPRCVGGTPLPDIGAYEFVPTAPCATAPPPLEPVASAPPNDFRFGKLKRLPGRGAAILPVIVPGPGQLTLRGKGLVRREASPAQARAVNLLVKAKGGKAKALRRKGKLKLRPLLSFTPSGGVTKQRAKPLVLRFNR